MSRSGHDENITPYTSTNADLRTGAAPNLTLIEVADPLLLEEMRADRRLARLLVAQLSDRVVLVKPGDEEAVMRALLKAGHTPKVINP